MFRRLLFVAFIGLALLFSQPLLSKSERVVKFTAYYQKLGDVLETIQLQSGIRLVYANSVVDSFKVFRKFEDSPYEAVRKSLLGTPLDFIRESIDLWVIVPRSQTEHLPAAVYGQVNDIHLEQPIAGANIYIEDSNIGTTTDNRGYFELQEIPPGKTNLYIKRIGYHDLELELSLRGNARKRIGIALEPKPVPTQEVVLEANNYPKENKAVLVAQKITSDQLRTPPLTNDGEVFEILHQQPGVSRRDMDDVFPHIEGGSATEVVVELDGMPVYVPTFGQNRRSVFAAPMIENITLHRSGFGVEYGNAMSGVIALETKDIKNIPFTTEASASLSGLSLNFRKNTQKLGVAGMWRNGKFNDDLHFDHFQGLDLFNKVEYRPSEPHEFTLLSLVSRGSFIQSNSKKAEEMVSQNLGLRYDYNSRNANNFSVLLYRSSLNTRQEELGVKVKADKKVSNALAATVGIDFYTLASQGTVILDSLQQYKVARDIELPTDIDGNFYIPIESNPADLFKQKATVLSPHWGMNLVQKFWRIYGGMRLPVNLEEGKIYLEPRIRLTLTPINFLNFSLTHGLYYQFSDRSYASEAKSGDNLGWGEFAVKTSATEPSRADHFRIESAFNFTRSIALSLAYFDKKYHFNDRAYLSRINRWFWSLPLKNGLSRGYEYWLGKTAGQLQGWISYTLNNEVYESENGTFFRPYFNRKNIFNVSLIYHLSSRLQFKGQFLKSSGYPQRDWGPDRVIISPENTPEIFARSFLTESNRFGSIRQYGFGLTWSFSGFSKENKLNLVAVQTLEEGHTGFDGGLKFWASLIFSN